MKEVLLLKGKRSWKSLLLILTVMMTCAATAQNITVSGTVTDEVGPFTRGYCSASGNLPGCNNRL
jgi:hypothetical protein